MVNYHSTGRCLHRFFVMPLMDSDMVVSLGAYVHASVRTDGYTFKPGFAVLLFLADTLIATAIVPSFPI